MFNTKRNKLALIAAMTLAMCLSGCGNRLPANAPIEEPAAGAETPVVDTPAPTTPVEPVTPAPTAPAYTAPITGSLTVSNVEKTKKGVIFFKKLTVSGSCVNTSNVVLSGTVTVDFKDSKGIINKRLETSETKTVTISNLAPGASFPFSVTATKSGDDDAEVTVTTTQPTATTAAAAGYGNAYGAPAGATTMGTRAATGPYGY